MAVKRTDVQVASWFPFWDWIAYRDLLTPIEAQGPRPLSPRSAKPKREFSAPGTSLSLGDFIGLTEAL